jgi:helicase SWR1
MTEIASPSPTHAIPPAAPGDNGQHHEQPPSTTRPEPADSVKQEPDNASEAINGFDNNDQDSEKPVEQQLEAETPPSNGAHDAHDALDAASIDDGPPAKRRRVRDTTPNNTVRKPKPESPPWKKIEAEGPSTFRAEDGRRKSGRINTVPLELQPGDKRITRRVLHNQHPSPPKNRKAPTNGHAPVSTPGSAVAKRVVSSSKQVPPKQ